MGTDTLKDHLNRLREQTETLRETLSAFKNNYTKLQFGMHRLESEINKSRELFEQLTRERYDGAQVIKMNTKEDDDIQLTA